MEQMLPKLPKYVTQQGTKYKAQIRVTHEKTHHVGMYRTPEQAALAADTYIVHTLESRGIAHIGRWELNYPEKQEPVEIRAIHWLEKNGYLSQYVQDGLCTVPPPNINPDEIIDGPNLDMHPDPAFPPPSDPSEVRAWYTEHKTDIYFMTDYWKDLGWEKYFPEQREFRYAISRGEIDPRIKAP